MKNKYEGKSDSDHLYIHGIYYLWKCVFIKAALLLSAIRSSEFHNDVNFDGTVVFCSSCKISISVETPNHLRNVLRHFNSDKHKFTAHWHVTEQDQKGDKVYKIISLRQTST